jgi:hypothetical protein
VTPTLLTAGTATTTSVEGAGTEFISINGDGDSTITAGSGTDNITINGDGDSSITAGSGNEVVSISGGGTLDIMGNFVGSATIGADSTLELGGGASGGPISFDPSGTGGTLQIDGTTMPTNVISGFAPGSTSIDSSGEVDTIDLASIPYASITSAALNPTTDVLTVVYGSNNTAALQLSGNYQNSSFGLASDGNGGTDIIDLGVSPQIDDPVAVPIPSTTTQTVILAGSNLIFVNTYDSTVSASYRSAIVAAENYWQSQITTAVIINESFSTEADGTTGFVGSNAPNELLESYSTLMQQLASHATSSDDRLSVSTLLKVTDPTNGAGFYITDAMAKALGLLSPTNTASDGTVYLNSSDTYFYNKSPVSGAYDAVSVLDHELSEEMGRLGGLGYGYPTGTAWGPMDLFRYSESGQRDYTGGSDGKPTFFSVDGTNLLTHTTSRAD